MTVCFNSLAVVVGRQNDMEASLLQTKAESTGTTKKVSSQPGSRVVAPDLLCKLQELVV